MLACCIWVDGVFNGSSDFELFWPSPLCLFILASPSLFRLYILAYIISLHISIVRALNRNSLTETPVYHGLNTSLSRSAMCLVYVWRRAIGMAWRLWTHHRTTLYQWNTAETCRTLWSDCVDIAPVFLSHPVMTKSDSLMVRSEEASRMRGETFSREKQKSNCHDQADRLNHDTMTEKRPNIALTH